MRMGQENDQVLPDIGANSTCYPQRHLVNYVLILRQKRLKTGMENIVSYQLMPTFNKLLSIKVASARFIQHTLTFLTVSDRGTQAK